VRKTMIKKADRDKGEQKIQEALKIIMALGLPRQQQNERSAPVPPARTMTIEEPVKPDQTG